MKPMQVEAGQHAPDVDELVEKAGSMIEKLQMDNSQIRNITGVEEAPMNHYYTNQQLPESPPEEVTNKGSSGPESVSFMENANPHQTGSTLDAHENPSGGDPHPPSSYTHSSEGKPPSDMRKQIEVILKKRCGCGTECGPTGICKNVSCSVSKAPPPGKPDIAALLGGAGGGDMPPPPGGDEGGPPDDMPPGEGELPPGKGDEPESKEDLTMKIHELVDKLAGADEG